jgi:hypothetical protein
MGKKQRKPVQVADLGTIELSRIHRTTPERSAGGVRIRVLDGNQIDRLLWSNSISPDEHSSLVGFQVDLHRASLTGVRAQTLEARVSGAQHDLSQSEAEHRLKVAQCITYLQNHYNRQVAQIILDLCMNDKKPPEDGWRHAIRGLVEFRERWLRERPDPPRSSADA